jgi:Ferritin-like domain
MRLPDWLVPIDRDDALAETLAGSAGPSGAGISRAQALRLAGGAAAATFALGARPARAAQPSRRDVAILNYALSLEYLQAAFYSEAERAGALRGSLAYQARIVGAHERAHVAAFRAVLGHHAIAPPHFDFHGRTEQPNAFRDTAVAFEDLAVAAYKDKAPEIESASYLSAAIAIHSVEARHAAWIRRLAGVLPATHAFDEPLSEARVERLVASTHFVVAAPRTEGRRSPRFTG